MDRFERVVHLHQLLKKARCAVSMAHLMDELECSRATVYRVVAYLRDALDAPLESGTCEQVGFCYSRDKVDTFELPGLWLSSEELAALLAMHALLERTDSSVLTGALTPLREKIERLLAERTAGQRLPMERIRVIGSGTRTLDQHVFRSVAGAVLGRQRINFVYRARGNDRTTRRSVSPQRIVHYRDNWYLDAWDHDKEALRSFAVDRMREVSTPDLPVRDLADSTLDASLAGGYGIFAGTARGWATIRFSAHAARWVADMHWHTQQQERFLEDGSFELRLPYANSRELLMDILKYGPDAELIAPVALREEMKMLLGLALQAYAVKP